MSDLRPFIKQRLYDTALRKGGCQEIEKILRSSDEELVELYYRNIEFCIDQHYPDARLLSQPKIKDICYYGGIVLMRGMVVPQNLKRYAMINDSMLHLKRSDFDFLRVYMSGNSILYLNIDNHAIGRVFAYDNCRVNITATDTAMVTVYQYSDNVTIKTKGNVIIKKK